MAKALQNLIFITFCAFIIVGCGRKGALEPPASAMITNDNSEMVEKPRVEKPFILDKLIK